MSECENWLEWLNVTRFSSMNQEERANFSKSLFYIRDAVLESARIQPNDKILDIGTGTGIIPILLSAKTEGLHFTGLEIQKESAESK